MWNSNAPFADLCLVWAKSLAHDGMIRGLLLEKGSKGLSAPKIAGKLGLRASVTGEIVIDGVEVSEDAMLPLCDGFCGLFECLNRARYGIAWGAMGVAADCWLRSVRYGLDRIQFNRKNSAAYLNSKLMNFVT